MVFQPVWCSQAAGKALPSTSQLLPVFQAGCEQQLCPRLSRWLSSPCSSGAHLDSGLCFFQGEAGTGRKIPPLLPFPAGCVQPCCPRAFPTSLQGRMAPGSPGISPRCHGRGCRRSLKASAVTSTASENVWLLLLQSLHINISCLQPGIHCISLSALMRAGFAGLEELCRLRGGVKAWLSCSEPAVEPWHCPHPSVPPQNSSFALPNVLSLAERGFRLEIREKPFPVRLGRPWDGSPRAAVAA